MLKENKECEYESDHSWHDDVKGFRKHLKTGGAVKLSLELIK